MERKWWHDSIVYQIYPRSYMDSNNDGISDYYTKRIYDGTFTGTLINGDGITARLLKEHGIKITGETTLDITE